MHYQTQHAPLGVSKKFLRSVKFNLYRDSFKHYNNFNHNRTQMYVCFYHKCISSPCSYFIFLLYILYNTCFYSWAVQLSEVSIIVCTFFNLKSFLTLLTLSCIRIVIQIGHVYRYGCAI